METILIPIVALLIPIIIVPTALGFRHARFLREVEHKERMRAMELGRTLPEDEALSPAGIATAVGVVVPLGSLGVAWMASMCSPLAAMPVSAAAGVVGLGGLAGGTILACRHFAARHQAAPTYQDLAKSEYDPDAYDVVGRRG